MDQTKALVNSVLPVIKNGKPVEPRTGPISGFSISPSEVNGVAAADRSKLLAAAGGHQVETNKCIDGLNAKT